MRLIRLSSACAVVCLFALAAVADELTLFTDAFDRADGPALGNGWVESEPAGAAVGIEGGRLVFLSTAGAANAPMVTRSFSRTASGRLVWDFNFDWSRTGDEKRYRLFMQLGDGALMNPDSWDAGVGVNLVWGPPAGHQRLGYRVGGATTNIAGVAGPTSIRVVVNLDLASYDILVDDVEVATFVPLDGATALDTLRLFTDEMNEANFSGRAFDDVAITLLGSAGNLAPTALNQSVAVAEDTSANVTLGVADFDGPGPYTFTIVSGPANGTLGSDDGDALVTYAPNPGFAGSDSFSFIVNDGLDDSAPATVDVTVGGPQSALRGLSEFDSGGAPTSEIVLARPADVLPGDLMIAAMTHGDKGSPTVTPPPGWTLVRDDTVATRIAFRVFQKVAGPSEPASYTFTLSRSKDPLAVLYAFRGGAIAAHDGASTSASSTTQTAPSIDATPGDVLLFLGAVTAPTSFTPPAGMAEITDANNDDRALTSALELASVPGPTGVRSSTSGAGGRWAAALVSVTLDTTPPGNAAPVAQAQSLSLAQDTTANLALGFSDLDGPGPHTFTIVTGPAHGTLGSDDGDAFVTYTPDPGYTGPDSFTFRVNDGLDDSAPATVSLSIAPNAAPVADDQALSVSKDTVTDIALGFADFDGPGPYAFTIVAGPTHGVLGSNDGDGFVTYAPDPGYTGADSFSFRVNDGLDDSNVATVSIEVSNEISLLADSFDGPDSTTVGNGWSEIEAAGSEVGIEGGRLVFAATAGAANSPMVTRSFGRTATGRLAWDFHFDWTRTGDEQRYRLFMQLGDGTLMDPGSWDAGVGVNLVWGPPAGHGVLGYRVGGVTSTIAPVSGPTSIRVLVNLDLASYDVLVDDVQVATFVPLDGVTALDTVRFFTDEMNEANFSGRAFDDVRVTLLGPAGNIPPGALNQSVAVPENATSDIVLGVADLDGPGPFTFTIVTGPAHGTLGDDDGDQLVTYTPDPGYSGPDSFTFRVNDGADDSNLATVDVTVGGPQVALRGFSEFDANGVLTDEVVFGTPAGVLPGDLLIAAMTHGDKDSPTVTPPPGWTLLRDDTVAGKLGFRVFQKIAGAAEPAAYTFTLNSTKHPIGVLYAFRGGQVLDQAGNSSAASSTSQVAPEVYAGADDVLLFIAGVKAATSFTPPVGMDEVTDQEDFGRTLTSALEVRTSAGPTGPRTSTSGRGGEWAAVLITVTGIVD